ncbi:MAG: hypothetical protein D6682_00175 [Zetaproteobacteria bacterium]|nr:MAG: hypothetical protein D6682_00175 [Zetaproteobacteria bacterium]
MLLPVLLLALPAHPTEASEYLYYRDVVIPPFKSMREFFDLPDRRGSYEVTVVSDSLGPLTFRVLRVQGEAERLEVRRRSYRIQNHLFQAAFDNRGGKDDLMVVIDNANPLQSARVSLYVIEPPP